SLANDRGRISRCSRHIGYLCNNSMSKIITQAALMAPLMMLKHAFHQRASRVAVTQYPATMPESINTGSRQ
ncbi:MAG TPA: hypothetical protein VFM11_07410, partial [Burkholderiales bacterium]|nr:hypothetical protein [Burkholderiales bacterium]